MYDEPFHVPEPDETILHERWDAGEEFRSVMLWKLGKGTVIYIRPGHETFPIYKDPNMLQLIERQEGRSSLSKMSAKTASPFGASSMRRMYSFGNRACPLSVSITTMSLVFWRIRPCNSVPSFIRT